MTGEGRGGSTSNSKSQQNPALPCISNTHSARTLCHDKTNFKVLQIYPTAKHHHHPPIHKFGIVPRRMPVPSKYLFFVLATKTVLTGTGLNSCLTEAVGCLPSQKDANSLNQNVFPTYFYGNTNTLTHVHTHTSTHTHTNRTTCWQALRGSHRVNGSSGSSLTAFSHFWTGVL